MNLKQQPHEDNFETFTGKSQLRPEVSALIKEKFLGPIENLPQEGWIEVHIPDDEEAFLRIRVTEYRSQFERGLSAYIAEGGDGSIYFESELDELRLNFDDTFSIREFTRKDLREYFLQDHEWRFLPTIADLPDEALIQVSWFPHDGSNTSKGKEYTMTAGQFRANFEHAADKMVNELSHRLEVGMGVFEDGEECTLDLAYHDIYDIYEYTPEMQARDKELKNVLSVLGELEKMGVPKDLFLGEENFHRYDKQDNMLWPEEMPKFTPEKIVIFAKIIENYQMQTRTKEVKSLFEDVNELEKIGVPKDLFSGEVNFLRYDEQDHLLWPVETPTFTPMQIVNYAKIIEKYLSGCN